jgi:hypothetical protein
MIGFAGYSQPASTLIQRRSSVRSYQNTPLAPDACRALAEILATLPPGPFRAPSRFELVAATSRDRMELRELGTYGFIKDAPAFIIGAAPEAPLFLEDFGYRMELIVLAATDLGLGTCWLGGTFNRSSFSRRISASPEEIIPAACALGYASQAPRLVESVVRQVAGPHDRLGWETLFFDGNFEVPLRAAASGAYAAPLEMVRLGPSASNKQPWRILRQGRRWHFFLRRTPGYREMTLSRFTGIADMQRIDLGIAMCHFELAAREAGLEGRWEVREPEGGKPAGEGIEYLVSWEVKE